MPKNDTPVRVADEDAQTPDNWINRNPELIRLTGKHPFNVEAPFPRLMSAGFITPAHLHFVRNHGAVPRVDEEAFHSWTIHVTGLVENAAIFTIQELKDRFQVVTLPVTLVCAGNRRKEQNMVRKSLGFNWGAAGVSTALWTGVYLADVLEYVRPIRGQAKHVVFEGVDSLPHGPYGTSQRLSWAASREKGMLVGRAAWAMNGLPLEPDHGFPIRVIIPGQIGGRSVKWLKKIEVADFESQHHLHYWDNKFLPRHLSPELARDEPEWWYDRNYLITELNVNSAISSPGHLEELHTGAPGTQVYTVRGYAYSGGGRRINRVEVSLDEGGSWRLCELEHPEDRYRGMAYSDEVYGMLDLTDRDTSFCWSFWSLDVAVEDLARANVIEVCAVDEAMNIQPRDMYLNATSMLNNCIFRVVVLRSENADSVKLTFEHPTLAGNAPGGWMERLKPTGIDLARPRFSEPDTNKPAPVATLTEEAPMTDPNVKRLITREELASQDKTRPWFVVRGEVYDGTGFLGEHPGGGDSILLVAGEDATEDFIAIHSADGRSKLAQFHIGTLVGESPAVLTQAASQTTDAFFLNPKGWKTVTLHSTDHVNHDSRLFRFALDSEDRSLGLPVGQHVFVRLRRRDTGELVQRAYTPVSRQNTTGSIEFLIKLYLPCEKYGTGGKMSVGFDSLVPGDQVELKGPFGSFIWQGRGTALYRGVESRYEEIGMVCAGSGITPIVQVLRAILDDAEDSTVRVWLICANRTEADILLREELDALQAMHGQQRFAVFHTLSDAVPLGWMYGRGRVSDAILHEHLPAPSERGLILACGPNVMIQETVRPGLEKCGWDNERQLVVF
ncbi:nitrate reductase [Auricularia subglabra TFB-10046 SS5]|nr:nitrate reductase [Auricularia subglabra TFB-10046 SS5]